VDAVAAAIARAALQAPIRAVLMDRLGPSVWHRSPTQAMAVLEELEETARLWLGCNLTAQPLGAAEIDDLRREFGARW